MLTLNHIKIEYHKLILECPLLEFPTYGLCIIKGGSGSGKSSLIKCLTMETPFYDSYLYYDQPMTLSMVEDKISVLYQDQILIEELSVEDHIKVIERQYQFQNTKDYIKRLQLEPLLKKYPNQLSGGEKTRVGLLLKIMKQSEILILDEPTSSLDLEFTHIVIDILKEYSLKHLVIVCTHDEEVIKEAEVLYEIKDRNIIFQTTEENTKEDNKKTYKENIRFPMFRLSLKLKKRRKIYHIGMMIGLSIFILLSSFGISLYFTSPKTENDFSSVYQDEILVYKSKFGFNGHGSEYPFTKEEINFLKSLKNIKKMEESYVYNDKGDVVIEKNGMLDFSGEDCFWISLWDKESELKNIDIENNEKYWGGISYCSYDEDIDYSKDIEVTLSDNKDGVYISKAVADILDINETRDDYYLEFTLNIPVYQIYGDAIVPYENEDGSYGPDGDPILEWMGIREKVKLPIKGILKSSNMGVGINYHLSIFFPNQFIQSYMEKYKAEEIVSYYWSDNINEYVRVLEDGDTTSKEIFAKPFEPMLYRLKIDDIYYMEEVIDEIREYGLFVVAGDYNPMIQTYQDNTDQIIMIVSISLVSILMIIYGIVQYLHREDEHQIEKFIESFGIKKSKKKIYKKYLSDFYILALIIGIIGMVYVTFIGPALDYPVHFTYYFIPVALAFAFIIMFIVPTMIYKMRK